MSPGWPGDTAHPLVCGRTGAPRLVNAIDGSTNAESGIRLQQVQRFTISGNSICNIDGTAVTCTHMSLTGNVIMHPGGSGVLVRTQQPPHPRQLHQEPKRSANATHYGICLSSTESP